MKNVFIIIFLMVGYLVCGCNQPQTPPTIINNQAPQQDEPKVPPVIMAPVIPAPPVIVRPMPPAPPVIVVPPSRHHPHHLPPPKLHKPSGGVSVGVGNGGVKVEVK